MPPPDKIMPPDSPFGLCPICPGQALQKWCFEGAAEEHDVLSLVLDHCPQCSGLWLTSDRLFLLHCLPVELLQRYIPFRYEAFVVCCNRCGQQMSRRVSHCSHCQQINTIACVDCHQAMDTQFVGGLQQDRCFRDHGFWLDHLAWIQIWDLPDRYFEASPFQGQSHTHRWSLSAHQKPPRPLQKKLKKHFAAAIRLRQGQGFAQDVANVDIATGQAAFGSLGVIGLLGKGALRVGWNFFRIFNRFD